MIRMVLYLKIDDLKPLDKEKGHGDDIHDKEKMLFLTLFGVGNHFRSFFFRKTSSITIHTERNSSTSHHDVITVTPLPAAEGGMGRGCSFDLLFWEVSPSPRWITSRRQGSGRA